MERTTDIGMLIKAIANAKDAEENRLLKEYGLTAMQMHVLMYLYDTPDHAKTLKEMERAMYVSQSTMAKLVRTLVEQKHLVSYADDPSDKRVKWVRLQSEAVPVCQKAEHIVVQMEEKLCQGLSEEEVELLREYLGRIYETMRS